MSSVSVLRALGAEIEGELMEIEHFYIERVCPEHLSTILSQTL
jgi:hypothetical protein